MFRVLLLSTAALVLAAQTPATEGAKAASKPAAAPAPVKVDKILATIGKTAIRESEFDLFLAISLNDQERMTMQFMPGSRDQYLTKFLEFKALEAKARKAGFQKKPEHAKKLAMMEMQLLITDLMERDGAGLQAQIKVTDADVKAYFDKHPEKFKTPENFSARHILVATKAMSGEKVPTDEEAKVKIAKVQAELAAGKTFDAAAKEYSDDPGSKDKGGLYENMAFGSFVPEFEQAVRAQAAGKVGEPVKSQYGYHLILVEKINPAVQQPFETAKEAATKQATTERQEQVMKAYMEAAKKEVSLQVLYVSKPVTGVKAKAKPAAAPETVAAPAPAAAPEVATAPAPAATPAPAPKVAQ